MCDELESISLLFGEDSIKDFVVDENIFLAGFNEHTEDNQTPEPPSCDNVSDVVDGAEVDAAIEEEKKQLLFFDEEEKEDLTNGKKPRLYANPDVDCAQSLVFFPNNLSRLLNEGDISALSHLFTKNCHKRAMVKMNSNHNSAVSVSRYIALMSYIDALYCDSMNCVHSTSVDGNKIIAKVYFTYTDMASMYAHAPVVVTDPMFRPAFVGKRVDIMTARLNLFAQPQSTQREIRTLLQRGEAIHVYGSQDITIIFDPFSQKILGAQFVNKMNSVGYQGKRYYLQSSDML